MSTKTVPVRLTKNQQKYHNFTKCINHYRIN